MSFLRLFLHSSPAKWIVDMWKLTSFVGAIQSLGVLRIPCLKEVMCQMEDHRSWFPFIVHVFHSSHMTWMRLLRLEEVACPNLTQLVVSFVANRFRFMEDGVLMCLCFGV